MNNDRFSETFRQMMGKRWPTWETDFSWTKIIMLERAFLDGIEVEQKRHLTSAMHTDGEGNAVFDECDCPLFSLANDTSFNCKLRRR